MPRMIEHSDVLLATRLPVIGLLLCALVSFEATAGQADTGQWSRLAVARRCRRSAEFCRLTEMALAYPSHLDRYSWAANGPAAAASESEGPLATELWTAAAEPRWISTEDRNRRVFYTTTAGIGVITVWGLIKWDYFSSSLKGTDEGWFGNSTKHGGADKLGHMFTTYATSHLLAKLYRHWRFEPDAAALYGALTSWAIMGYMEFGDAFSDYGFSYEDMIANTVGCALGYAMYRYPSLAEKVNLRWEYGFHPESSDVLTDYENSKFLVALKLNGFEPIRQTWLRHFEIHIGYYTRGFDDNEPDRERNLYVGIGLNLTDLLTRHAYKTTGGVLRYMQVPYTYYEHADDLN